MPVFFFIYKHLRTPNSEQVLGKLFMGVLESPGKVLDFFVSKRVGILRCNVYIGHMLWANQKELLPVFILRRILMFVQLVLRWWILHAAMMASTCSPWVARTSLLTCGESTHRMSHLIFIIANCAAYIDRCWIACKPCLSSPVFNSIIYYLSWVRFIMDVGVLQKSITPTRFVNLHHWKHAAGCLNMGSSCQYSSNSYSGSLFLGKQYLMQNGYSRSFKVICFDVNEKPFGDYILKI